MVQRQSITRLQRVTNRSKKVTAKVVKAAAAPYAPLAKFGSAPRTVAAQGTHIVTRAQHPRLQSQILYPKPVVLSNRTATQHISASAPLRSAPTDKHPGTMNSARVLRPYGGPPPTPLMLGHPRQIGRSTVQRVAVSAPPQTLIPNVMRKLFGR